MATLLGISPGAARRDGGGRAIWPPTPPIYVSPDSLRPGLDLVRVCITGGPIDWGTWCLYCGNFEGRASVVPFGSASSVMIDPWYLDEPEFLYVPQIDPMDFEEGWGFGRYASVHEVPVSSRATGDVPTAYSRGLIKGYEDQEHGRVTRPASAVPYNEVVRALAERFPEEYGSPALSRAKRMLGVAA